MNKASVMVLTTLIGIVLLPRLSIDFYLPFLPYIKQSLDASKEQAQMTLTIFMFGYAFAMLMSGYLSDRYGYRKILCISLILFIAFSFLCLLSSTVNDLIIARFFQALCGCCGVVIARMIVRDRFSEENRLKILTHLSSAMAISPLLFPVIGGWAQLYLSWRYIFSIFAIIGFILLILISRTIRNLDSPTKRANSPSFKVYLYLLTNRYFIGYSLTIGFCWSAYFSFTIESPFLFHSAMKYNSIVFSFFFSLAVLGYFFGAQITRLLSRRCDCEKMILSASVLCFFGALIMVALVITIPHNCRILTIPMFMVMLSVGVILPCTQSLIFKHFSDIVGTASGLFCFIQMTIGAISGMIVQSFNTSSSLPVSFIILILSILLVLTFYLVIYSYRKTSKYMDILTR